MTVTDYVKALDKGTVFTQANYGDGEWSCILGLQGENCNGERYTQVLGDALIDTLLKPRFTFFGHNPGAKLDLAVKRWLATHKPAVKFVDKEILSDANLAGTLGPFIGALRRRRVMLIGPGHLRDMPVLDVAAFLEVPEKDAFGSLGLLLNDMRAAIRKKRIEVICISSGMATNATMYRLTPEFPKVTMIDTGAIWDPYAGRPSRKGYRENRFLQSMITNARGDT